MKTGTCKLCLQEKPLLNKSHIIPDFMYRHGKIYHDDHSIHRISLEKTTNSNYTKKGIQYSGEYEGGILCKNCDGIIIKEYEDYAINFLFGKNLKTEFIYTRGKGDLTVSNVDSGMLKLFFLSIFWRSSISSRSFFKHVKLPKEVEEKLRLMILNGSPGKKNDFPFIPVYDFGKDPKLKQYMGQPVGLHHDTSYLFVFPAMFVQIFLHKKMLPRNLRRYGIRRKGKIKFLLAPPQYVRQMLHDLYG